MKGFAIGKRINEDCLKDEENRGVLFCLSKNTEILKSICALNKNSILNVMYYCKIRPFLMHSQRKKVERIEERWLEKGD
jgi:hypothetical protein